MKIYAHHAHVFPKSVREDGTVDALLNVMDACSIEKAVAFATFSNFLGPGDEEPNQALAKRIRNEDRLKGFGVIDFSREDLEDQVDQMEKDLQESHVLRLTRGECTAEAGMIFSDIISGLERVSDHATNIAFYLLDEDHVERQKEKREDRWKDF